MYYGRLRIVSPAKPIAQTHVLKWDNSGNTSNKVFSGTTYIYWHCDFTYLVNFGF